MASAAQAQANLGNAQFSTGPRSVEGKARSSRNNLQHGLTLGVLAIEPAEQAAFDTFRTEMRGEIHPEGAMVEEAFQQFLDAAWRLRKIRAIVREWNIEYAEDPFVHPETEARLRQLNRYRAAAEMVAFRAIRTIRELQTLALFRRLHLTEDEAVVLPPLVNPGRKILLGREMMGVEDRKLYYQITGGVHQFTRRFPVASGYTPPG